ncbi:MAG: deoxyribonuclease IV [Spirochaetes bacterium]|nr:deoxyribonuclease IV [Spirochaetota bacterium]
MKYIGAHVSAAGGVENAPLNAMKIGAKAFALFTKNQKQWRAKPLTEQSIENFKKNLQLSGISPQFVLPHDSYLINIGNPHLEARTKSINALLEEALRVEQLGLNFLNFHPGAHLKGLTEEECLNLIAEGLNQVIKQTKNCVMVIETTAGQGTVVGYSFQHIKKVIDKVKNPDRVGVCIDTCHIFTAGYDLRTQEKYENVMEDFEKTIGFSFLKGVHLNDSKKDFHTRKDRHETLGNGYLGPEAFRFIMNDHRFDNIPLILETPEPEIWAEEIKWLYGLTTQLS